MSPLLLLALSGCDWRAALVERQEDKLRESPAGQFYQRWAELKPRRYGLESDKEATALLRELHAEVQGALSEQCATESWSTTHYRTWSMIEQERFGSVAEMHADPLYLETLAISELSTTRGCDPLIAAEVCVLLVDAGDMKRICG